MLAFFSVLFLLMSVVLVSSASMALLSSCLFLVCIWCLFISFFSGSFNMALISSWMFQDEVAFFMVFLTVSILLFSLCFGSPVSNNSTLFYVYSITLLCCMMVFTSSSVFLIYLYYELALLPILYMIVAWGAYTDRVLGSLMLFLYTAIFTLPFLWVIFLLEGANSSWALFICSGTGESTPFMALLVALAFCVKLPVYGLHLWLPMAHVEAPTSGSMILAGILLKLGGVGLLRFSMLVDYSCLSFLMSYLFISLIYSTLLCSFQSDFKRMVAYSSVSHMMMIPILILSNNLLSFKCVTLIMLFHGLSSPVMFMSVSILYDIFKTRQIVFMKSLLLTNPLISFLLVPSFFFTVSAPPFPSFTAEAFSFIACYPLSSLTLFFFGVYAFLSMIYNLVWLISIVVNSSSSSKLLSPQSYQALPYYSFMCVLLALFLGLAFIVLFMFI